MASLTPSEPTQSNGRPHVRSLKQDAEISLKVVQDVEGLKDDFNQQYHVAMKEADGVKEKTEEVQGIVGRALPYLDRARALLLRRGVPETQAVEKVVVARSGRDQSLYDEDFTAVREFYENIASLIVKLGVNKQGMTNNEFVAAVVDIFKDDPMWQKIMARQEFGFDAALRKMLSGKMTPAEMETFENTLIDGIDEEHVAHAVENIFMALRPLCGVDGKVVTLTELSVYGMMGRVLPKDKMDAVFKNNDVSAIRELASGSVELSFADRRISFYHSKDSNDVPAEVTQLMNAQIPSKILLVHYHTDEDMKKLFRDMSDGQRVSGTARGTSDRVVIEGISNSDEVRFIETPPSWNDPVKQKFINNSPMEFMKNDFKFKNADSKKSAGSATGETKVGDIK